MGLIVRMPSINANDATVELLDWLVQEGAQVRKGDVLCIVETTKSLVDVVAEGSGLFRPLVAAGASHPVGLPIAFLAESADEPLPDLSPPQAPSAASSQGRRAPWTAKAKLLAERLGVDLARLVEENPDVVIGVDLVNAAAARRVAPATDVNILEMPSGIERVLILGGGGGAALVLDILSRQERQKAVGILDNNPAKHGETLMGVPILGGFDAALAYWQAGAFDTLISTVVRDVNDRAAIFERFTGHGIPFTNVIDPAVRIGLETQLGSGNLIVYGGYLATGVSLGDNNFLAAGTYIEHHSRIGSHCTFGPRTSLSGAVKVGDRAKFGTQVAVEPQLEIGEQAVIASGVVVTAHVPAKTLVKSSTNPVYRHGK